MPDASEFELLGRMTIGQYLPTGSPVHRLDARVKLLAVVLGIIAVVFSRSLLALFLLLLVVVFGLWIARIPSRYALAGLSGMMPFLLLLALLQVFAIPQYRSGAASLWHWGPLTVSDRSLLAGLLLIARFVVMGLALSLFSFCTSTTELTHGIEHLLRPLQALRLPAHEFALVVNVAVRFLPILAEEAERLMKAQAARGADFGRGQRNVLQRARLMLPLLVPLFLIALRRAEELAEAMSARCYLGGRGRTHLIQLRANLGDYVAFVVVLCLVVLLVYLSAIDADRLVSTHLLSLVRS